MNIKWLGHSCFLLTSNQGTALVTDPFDEATGYSIEYPKADIVTLSHHHHDHDSVESVSGSFQVIDLPGRQIVHGIDLTGYPTYHDDANGAKRGKNTLFKIVMDGIKLLHLGDLGHTLSNELLRQIEEVDILFIPVGGYYTIDAWAAASIVHAVKPKIVIPMHYKTVYIDFPITNEKPFLDLMAGRQIKRLSSSSQKFEADTLTDNAVYVFPFRK